MGGDKDLEGSDPQYYNKGNEAFVAENYKEAIEQYSNALSVDPQFVDCLVARAHAYTKSDSYDLAKKDADKAIDITRAWHQPNTPTATKAFLRSGVASFHLGRYKEAKNCFLEGQKLGEESGLAQWMTWCDEKIKKYGDFAPGVKPDVKKVDPPPQPEIKKDIASEIATLNVEKPEVATSNSYDASAMPVAKISHDWYQTETTVVVEVRIKKLSGENVAVEIQEATLSVTVKLPTGSDYSLELDLAHPVVPDQSSYRILSTKLEIKLRKAEGVRWSALEGDGSAPLPGGAPPTNQQQKAVKGPYASGRDWNQIDKNLAAEADEKKEGEAALNEMFQKIYGDANDDVKRAMNKSFQESGGTVLSTNWADIGKQKTEIKPPDGMEHKKWD